MSMPNQPSLNIAKEIIEKIQYLTLATVTENGNPWNSPVYTAYDDKYNFYWASDQKNIHSQNIMDNGKVFAVIYDSTAPAGSGFGVYFQGIAKEVRNPLEIGKAIMLLYTRAKDKPAAIELFMKKFPRRIYVFMPDKVWVNGDSERDGDFVDIRTEIPLLEK